MIRSYGIARLANPPAASLACIGTFDGIHIGHQEVLRTAVERARAAELPAVAVTFDRHPATILRPESVPEAIGTLGQNLRQMESCGIDMAVVLPFDREMSETSADSFLNHVIKRSIGAESLVVGRDFAFGKGREGTPEWLNERIPTEVVEPVQLKGTRVSSSAIRQAIVNGELVEANRLLGRRFCLEGVVVHGEKLGRTLGFPTANLMPVERQVRPAHGVYGGEAFIQGFGYPAAIAIGTRPAVGGSDVSIEAHLLDFEGGSLYGHRIELAFDQKLRDEMDFPDLEALKSQMTQDVESVRRAQLDST